MSSIKESEKKSHATEENLQPEYTPLIPQQWLSRCQEFSNFNLIKYPRIFQSLIYLLKFKTREEVCEFDTNKLSWKYVRCSLVGKDAEEMTLFKAIGEYNPFGPKEDEYKEYEKLEFIQNNIEGISPDTVDNFSVALGKLLRWLKFAIEVRIDDVVKRRKKKEFERA